jgi:hypothetical protein
MPGCLPEVRHSGPAVRCAQFVGHSDCVLRMFSMVHIRYPKEDLVTHQRRMTPHSLACGGGRA